MANSADLDQLVFVEANWSGPTLFAKAGHIRIQQVMVVYRLSSFLKKIWRHLKGVDIITIARHNIY